MILSQLFSNPALVIVWITAILYAMTVHEFSHALAAKLLGDDTPEREGRLSLNPAAHVDMMGLVLLVVAGFGWGRPVQFNASRLRNPRLDPALVGLAGPFANLLSVVVFGLLTRLAINANYAPENLMVQFFLYIALLNTTLMVFNLLPVPPLDGSHLLLALLPERFWRLKIWLVTRGALWLMGLVLIDIVTGGLLLGGILSFFHNLVFKFVLS
ncbi:site-2 protease family protein [Candidatus Uhrbacteria bacterium]|nr:site-2 protease family protein [Candidatus Uhrbacteria bacterium]